MSRNDKLFGEILLITKEITTMVVGILDLQYHI